MARTDTLTHYLKDVADSIREQTTKGFPLLYKNLYDESLLNAATFDNLVKKVDPCKYNANAVPVITSVDTTNGIIRGQNLGCIIDDNLDLEHDIKVYVKDVFNTLNIRYDPDAVAYSPKTIEYATNTEIKLATGHNLDQVQYGYIYVEVISYETLEKQEGSENTVPKEVLYDGYYSRSNNFPIVNITTQNAVGPYGTVVVGTPLMSPTRFTTYTVNRYPINNVTELNNLCVPDAQLDSDVNVKVNTIKINTGTTANPVWTDTPTSWILGYIFPETFPTTSIPNNFLTNCINLYMPIILPNNIKTIGKNFLAGCIHFNAPVIQPMFDYKTFFESDGDPWNDLLTINDNFMLNCYSFNQPLILYNLIDFRENFMKNCYSFNQNLIIGLRSVTDGRYGIFGNEFISTGFLMNCHSFNSIIGSVVLDYTISQGTVTNEKIYFTGDFLEHVSGIEDDVLKNCYSFNKPFNINNIKESIFRGNYISNNFMENCYSFSQNFRWLGDYWYGASSAASVGSNFMKNCKSLKNFIYSYTFENEPVPLAVDSNFLDGCTSLKTVNIPYINNTSGSRYSFLNNTESLQIFATNSAPSSIVSDEYDFLMVNNKYCEAYIKGITILSTEATAWRNYLTDETVDPGPYRKIITMSIPVIPEF